MTGSFTCCPCLMRLKGATDDEERQRRQTSRKIDKQLAREKQLLRKQVKLLLLGAGESGKSTFLKQMRLIHGVRFDAEALAEFRADVYQNVLRGMQVLVDARHKLGIEWQEARRAAHAERILRDGGAKPSRRAFLELVPCVRELWRDEGIRTAYARRVQFQLSDSVRYFFDDLDRLTAPDYEPSDRDILHARKATKSIAEFTVVVNGVPFRFVDVGGQRSQRHKWLQCFEGVTSILFLVASSEFDQVLLEDRHTNRLTESRNVFETIVNHWAFGQVSFILFLNKTDLLELKVQSGLADISHHFPDFAGDPRDLMCVQNFILAMFESAKRDRKKPLFHHFTTAIDTENIKVVFNAVRDSILERNITQLMLQ